MSTVHQCRTMSLWITYQCQKTPHRKFMAPKACTFIHFIAHFELFLFLFFGRDGIRLFPGKYLKKKRKKWYKIIICQPRLMNWTKAYECVIDTSFIPRFCFFFVYNKENQRNQLPKMKNPFYSLAVNWGRIKYDTTKKKQKKKNSTQKTIRNTQKLRSFCFFLILL